METRGRKSIEMIGRTFGRLTILESAGRHKNGRLLYKCECRCGTIKTIDGVSLRSGSTISCGCALRSNRKAYFIGIVEEAKRVAEREKGISNGR